MVIWVSEAIRNVVSDPLAAVADEPTPSVAAATTRPATRQVVIGANFHHDAILELDLGQDPDAPELAMFKGAHEAVTPEGPEHWELFFHRSAQMWRDGPTLTVDDLARIEAPTLVLAADDELVALEHTCAMYEAIPASQLAIVPGTSHFLLVEKPDLANRLIVDFLAETGPPTTFAPVRRA